ncbi:hypothetical protein [Roseomonas genomospecies 6]|uniref:Uncharacterized protein n=1 Tax=Roseomonas genomospecies 6 TaxID=214106 RepID=A0A9W7KQV4_9PROT|nr:hypothetical protein [Roseomonas genomospecies 6]KAA0677663.1 hypothetical protein DS843_22760 [Roseomonas genomospecies 6]
MLNNITEFFHNIFAKKSQMSPEAMERILNSEVELEKARAEDREFEAQVNALDEMQGGLSRLYVNDPDCQAGVKAWNDNRFGKELEAYLDTLSEEDRWNFHHGFQAAAEIWAEPYGMQNTIDPWEFGKAHYEESFKRLGITRKVKAKV